MDSIKAKILSASVSIASIGILIGFGISSFAWFGNNNKTEATGIEIKTLSKSDIAIENEEYQVYGYDIATDKPIVLSKDLKLGEYNIFVPGRNTYNRRIIRMTFTYPRGVTMGSHINIAINCFGNLFKDDTHVDEKISNLINFKFFDNYQGTIPQIDDSHTISDVYDACCQTFDGINDSYKFVQLDGSNASKPSNFLSFDFPMPSLSTEKEEYVSDFLIEYNYDDKLVDYYKQHSNYTFDLSFFKEGTTIPFSQDIEAIEFNLVRNE